MRIVTVVPECELGLVLQPHPSAVTISPWFRSMNLDFLFQGNLGGAAKRFAEDVGLKAKLGVVGRMLIMAAATAGKVLTTWLRPLRSWRQYSVELGAREA